MAFTLHTYMSHKRAQKKKKQTHMYLPLVFDKSTAFHQAYIPNSSFDHHALVHFNHDGLCFYGAAKP